MPLAFRQLINASYWDKEREEDEEWLHPNEVRADTFKCLKSDKNRLSIYVINDESELQRLLAAVASNRNNVQHLDYALFDFALLDKYAIEYIDEPGVLPDDLVCNWHKDIIQLDGSTLHKLAKVIYEHSEPVRALDKKIAKAIQFSINKTHIDSSKLKPSMLNDLQLSKYK